MSKTEPPEVVDVRFTSSAPFVGLHRRQETRNEHALLAVTLALVMVGSVTISTVPMLFGIPMGVMAGYEFHNWLVFDDLYGGGA